MLIEKKKLCLTMLQTMDGFALSLRKPKGPLSA